MKCSVTAFLLTLITVSVFAAGSVSVPIRDARGTQEDGVQMAAAAISDNSQVIVFFGDDYEAWDTTVRAANGVLEQGKVPLRGIILADPLRPVFKNGFKISGEQEIELYADGQLTGTIELPKDDLGQLLVQWLHKDYEQIIVPSARKKD